MNTNTVIDQSGIGAISTDNLTPKLPNDPSKLGASINSDVDQAIALLSQPTSGSEENSFGQFSSSSVPQASSSTSLYASSKELTGNSTVGTPSSTDGLGSSTSSSKFSVSSLLSPIRLEAENMKLSSYWVEQSSVASGGKMASLLGGAENQTGKATGKFQGPSGTYDVVLAYFDESDGVGSIEAKVNGKTISKTVMDANLDWRANSQSYTSKVVAKGVYLKAGDTIELAGQENSGEHARIDYVDFVPTKTQAVASPQPVIAPKSTTSSSPLTATRIEAESMQLKGFRTEKTSAASGGSLVGLLGGNSNEVGEATATFNGTAGKYKVVLSHFDEDDGISSVEVKIDGKTVNTFSFDKQLDWAATSKSKTDRVVAADVYLQKGSTIQIIGKENGGEPVRIDYIDILPSNGSSTDNSSGSGGSGSSGSGSSGGSTGSTGGSVTPPPPPVVAPSKPSSGSSIIPSSAKLLFSSDFSNSSASEWKKEQGASHQFRVENGAGRFELRKDDPIAARGKRVEYNTYGLNTLSGSHWYTFKLQLPTSYSKDPSQEHIAQWQGAVNGKWTSPSMALVTRNGEFVLEGAWFSDSGATKVNRINYWKGAYEPGKWVEFTMNVNFSSGNDGFVKVWKDGKQIVDFKGKNSDPYRDAVGLKIGIYKQDWARGTYSATNTRVLYYDDVKILKG